MLRTFQFRLYPNATQRAALEFVLRDNAETYNAWKLTAANVESADLFFNASTPFYFRVRCLGGVNFSLPPLLKLNCEDSLSTFYSEIGQHGSQKRNRLVTHNPPRLTGLSSRVSGSILIARDVTAKRSVEPVDDAFVRIGYSNLEPMTVSFSLSVSGSFCHPYRDAAFAIQQSSKICSLGWFHVHYCTTVYVTKQAGVWVVPVNPRGTSQLCSGCGQNVPKDLSQRTHACPYCGLVLGRDHNAGRNILSRGMRAAGLEPSKCLR